LRRQFQFAFAVVLLVLLADSIVAFWSTLASQQAADRATLTYTVIDLTQDAQKDLVDMETGYRGFLLTSDEAFLEPYVDGRQHFQADLAQLRAMTANNPNQMARWQDLEQRATAWQRDVTEPGIALRRAVTNGAGSLTEIIAFVSSGRGKSAFDGMRTVFAAAEAAERTALAQGTQEATAASQWLLVVLVAGMGLASGLSLLAAFLLARSIVDGVGQLAGAAQRIAGGDLESRIRLQRRDEIGLAGGGFDRMADHLRAAIEQTESIVNSAGEGILGYDDQDRVTFVNPAAALMLGYARDELVGMPGHATLHHSRADGTPYPSEGCPIHSIRDAQAPSRVAYEVLWRKDGRSIPVEYVCAPLRGARGASGAVLVFQDISERKRVEEAQRRYQAELVRQRTELERSNRELQDFASVASHDLQEPLRKVQAFGDRLSRKYAAQLDDEGRGYLARMQDAAARMRILISDLLTFSRVTTKAQPFVAVDLGGVVREVVSDLEVAIERSGGRIEMGALPTIEADPLQMHQLFQNLLSNALKFSRPDIAPCVRITSRCLSPDGLDGIADASAPNEDGQLWHEIRVEDNGIGFDEKYLDRIFTIFQRLHGRGAYEGTGVGLAVCRKIVDRHGGAITARSAPEHGATFVVALPGAHTGGQPRYDT
jgi:PAS domain S-box-containing protein